MGSLTLSEEWMGDVVGERVGWEEGPDWRRKENDSGDSCVKGEKNIKKHSYIKKEEGGEKGEKAPEPLKLELQMIFSDHVSHRK